MYKLCQLTSLQIYVVYDTQFKEKLFFPSSWRNSPVWIKISCRLPS